MMETINLCHICQENKSVKPVFDLSADLFKCVFADVAYSEHTLICSKCFEIIERLFDFKKSCLEMKSSIKLMYGTSTNETQQKIKDADGINVKNEESDSLSICSICLEINPNSASLVFLATPNVKLMLNKCLPELNVDAIEDPVSCSKCFRMLEKYFSLSQSLENIKVKCEPTYDEEIPVYLDNLKQEELEIKDVKVEKHTKDYLDEDVHRRSSPSFLSEDSCERFMEGEQLIKVDEVQKRFTQKRNIKLQLKEKHFACTTCKKQFADKSNLKRHMRLHTGEKPFTCGTCEKQFTDRSNLISHMKIHTGARPFTCSRCKKQFTAKNSLTYHMRLHSGEKPHACVKCEKQFTMKNSLVYHMRLHSGEKPFACNRCEKQFFAKDILIRHMRTHTGEKPFACDTCGKQFTNKGNLTRHRRIHTGEKPFACNRCDKQYTDPSNLIKHMKRHIEDKPFA